MPQIIVKPSKIAGSERVLSQEAIDFVVGLDQMFHGRRDELLTMRATKRAKIAAGATLDFLSRWFSCRFTSLA